MKGALAQINPIVGDVVGNTDKITTHIGEAKAQGASLVVFSELAVVGYPAWDLMLKPRFVQANVEAVHRIAEYCRGVAALVGFIDWTENGSQGSTSAIYFLAVNSNRSLAASPRARRNMRVEARWGRVLRSIQPGLRCSLRPQRHLAESTSVIGVAMPMAWTIR